MTGTTMTGTAMTGTAAFFFCALLIGLAVFQLALIAGLPLGRFAWGGRHRVLPAGLRFGGAAAIILYGLFAAVVLDKAGRLDVLPQGWSQAAVWVIVAYLVLGVVMNAISPSRAERLVMTPVALLLLASALMVALG